MLPSKNEGGFTIVELLVVIVVIAILVALTLPNIFGLQRRERDETRKSDVRSIQKALEGYYQKSNAYPANLDSLVPDYLQAIPNNPQGDAYSYTGAECKQNKCQTYTLSADLENSNDPVGDPYVIESVNQ